MISNANGLYIFSKKDCLVRRQELVKAASKPILQCIIDHIGELGHNNSALLFIVAAVKHTTGTNIVNSFLIITNV